MRRRILRWAQPVFLALACVFIGLLLYSQWQRLLAYPWRLNPAWFATACLLLLITWSVEVNIWRYIMRLLGGYLPYWPAGRIWFMSAVVRYIPGNIWQPLSMTIYCRRWGIRPEATFTSILLYQVVILLAVAPISAVYFLTTGNFGLLTGLLDNDAGLGLLLLSVVPVLVFLLRPGWLIAILNWLLHKLRRTVLETHLSSRRLLFLLVIATVDWILWGATFAALTFSLGAYSPHQVLTLTPHLVAAYAIAYAIGFISFITPSGFGVREGAFYLLLVPVLSGAVVTVAALAMRIWTMCGELLMAAISAAVERRTGVAITTLEAGAPPAAPVEPGLGSELM